MKIHSAGYFQGGRFSSQSRGSGEGNPEVAKDVLTWGLLLVLDNQAGAELAVNVLKDGKTIEYRLKVEGVPAWTHPSRMMIAVERKEV